MEGKLVLSALLISHCVVMCWGVSSVIQGGLAGGIVVTTPPFLACDPRGWGERFDSHPH